jgi:hypothetical protein
VIFAFYRKSISGRRIDFVDLIVNKKNSSRISRVMVF